MASFGSSCSSNRRAVEGSARADSAIARTHFGNAALSLAQLYRASVNIEQEASLRMLDRVRHFCTVAAGPDNAPPHLRTVSLAQILRFLEVQENAVTVAAQRGTEPKNSNGASVNPFSSAVGGSMSPQQNQQLHSSAQHEQRGGGRGFKPRNKRQLWQTDIDTAILAAKDLEDALSSVTMGASSAWSPPYLAGNNTPSMTRTGCNPPQRQHHQRQRQQFHSNCDNNHDFDDVDDFNQNDNNTHQFNNGDDDDDDVDPNTNFMMNRNHNRQQQPQLQQGQFQQQQQHSSEHVASPEFAYQQMQFPQGSRWVRRRVEDQF